MSGFPMLAERSKDGWSVLTYIPTEDDTLAITQHELDAADGQFVSRRTAMAVDLSSVLALNNTAMDLDPGEAEAFDELTGRRAPRLVKPLSLE